jgi:hypothetical protein
MRIENPSRQPRCPKFVGRSRTLRGWTMQTQDLAKLSPEGASSHEWGRLECNRLHPGPPNRPARPHVRLSAGRPVSQYAGNELRAPAFGCDPREVGQSFGSLLQLHPGGAGCGNQLAVEPARLSLSSASSPRRGLRRIDRCRASGIGDGSLRIVSPTSDSTFTEPGDAAHSCGDRFRQAHPAREPAIRCRNFSGVAGSTSNRAGAPGYLAVTASCLRARSLEFTGVHRSSISRPGSLRRGTAESGAFR